MGETYNPIGPARNYDNGFFSQIPVPPPGYANVLTGGQIENMPLVIQAQDVPRKEQIRQGKYRWITQIDIQPHGISFDADLLAKDNISHFSLTANLTARVESPGLVCMDNITDIAAAVKSSLLPELQAKAIQYSMDDIQQLRDDLDNWSKDITTLESGIQLSGIRIHLQPDRAYISRKEQLRREEQEKEDKLRKLREKEEYEKERAKVAGALSQEYSSDEIQFFAELASDSLSPEEVSRRIEERRKNQSAEAFDETVRRTREAVNILKMMQDGGIGSPDLLSQMANQVLASLFPPSAISLEGGDPSVRALGEGSSEQADKGVYAPPSDD